MNNATGLEELQIQYQNLLIQYNQNVADYTNNYLQNRAVLDDLSGNAFYGGRSLGIVNANNPQECKLKCKNNRLCTGATYISNTKKCHLRRGDGDIVTSNNNTYAIVPRNKIKLRNIQTINQRLINMNGQIQNALNTINNNSLINLNNNLENYLKVEYDKLMLEKKDIDKILDEYDSIDMVDEENIKRSRQNYYVYVLLSIVVCICILILVAPLLPSVSTINMNIMSLIKSIDASSEDNPYTIVIILIAVPITYLLLKTFWKKLSSKFTNKSV